MPLFHGISVEKQQTNAVRNYQWTVILRGGAVCGLADHHPFADRSDHAGTRRSGDVFPNLSEKAGGEVHTKAMRTMAVMRNRPADL